jgi:hypothetical protein
VPEDEQPGVAVAEVGEPGDGPQLPEDGAVLDDVGPLDAVGALGGGVVVVSELPVLPAGRWNQVPVAGSTSTITVICSTAGVTVTTFSGRKAAQAAPV